MPTKKSLKSKGRPKSKSKGRPKSKNVRRKNSRKPRRCTKLLVMRGKCKKTAGGLTKDNLTLNKSGKIVSKRKSNPLPRKMRFDQAFCLKCRSAVPILGAMKTKTRTGLKMLKGSCGQCGTRVCKILPKNSSSPQ
jgi:hypothetical protein